MLPVIPVTYFVLLLVAIQFSPWAQPETVSLLLQFLPGEPPSLEQAVVSQTNTWPGSEESLSWSRISNWPTDSPAVEPNVI